MTMQPTPTTPPPNDVGAELNRSITGRHLRLGEFVFPLDIGDSTTDGAARLTVSDGIVALEIYSRELGGYVTLRGLVAPAAGTSDLKDAMVTAGIIDDGGESPLNLDGAELTAGLVTADSLRVIGTATLEGELAHTGSTVGFFGVTPAAVPAATDDIKDALALLGLLTNGGASPLNLDGGALTAGTTNVTTLTASSSMQANGIFFANAGLEHIAGTLRFWNGAGQASKPAITGVRTGTLAQLQTVVANILSAGATYGLWTDSTT